MLGILGLDKLGCYPTLDKELCLIRQPLGPVQCVRSGVGEPEVVFIRDYSSHPVDLSTVLDYWPVLGAIRQSVATGFGFRTDDSAVVKAQTFFEQPSHGTNPGRRIRFGLLGDLQSFADFAPVHSFDSASFYPAGGTGGRVRFSPRNRNALARLWSAWEYPRNTGFCRILFF